VAKDAYYEFKIENALSPFSFPSLLRMENEIIPMISSMFHVMKLSAIMKPVV
jgi:hypothetical protein